MDFTLFFAFTSLVSLLVMSPGPNGFLILSTVPNHGVQAGLLNVAGICSAFFIHASLSILGISSIILASASLFFVIKFLGALYLIFLGLNSLYLAFFVIHTKPTVISNKLSSTTNRQHFLNGLFTNLFNPKVSIFYLAAFPQFIGPLDNSLATSYLLVSCHALIAALWFSFLSFSVQGATTFFNSIKVKKHLNYITGTVLILFGYKLLTLEKN